MRTVAAAGDHVFVVAGDAVALFRTTDGDEWARVERPGGPVALYELASGADGSLLAVGGDSIEDDRVFRSSDGATWEALAPVGSVTTCQWSFSLSALHVTDTGALLVGLSCNTPLPTLGEILRSSDGGASWTVVSPISSGFDAGVSGFAQHGGTLFAVHSHATFEGGNLALLRSADDGRTWTSAELPTEWMRQLVAAGDDGVLVRTWGGDSRVLRSADGAPPWVPSSLHVESSVARLVPVGAAGVAVAPASAFSIAGAPASGVPLSLDGGETWTALADGLGPHPVTAVAALPDGRLVALAFDSATGRVDAYRTAGNVLSDHTPPAADALALSASPSPANAHVEVSFDLPEAASVTLAVYDVQGRRVAVVAAGDRPAGSHRATWDARQVAPGTYVLALRAGRSEARRTVVVAR